MRAESIILGLFLVAVATVGAAPEDAAPDKPLTDKEWDAALAAVEQVALDATNPADLRSAAVATYAKMQLLRGAGEKALPVCKAVFDNPHDVEVAAAAARAAVMVRRRLTGHLAGGMDLVESWHRSAKGPASKRGGDVVKADIVRWQTHLMNVAKRNLVAQPTYPDMPHWGRAAKDRPS